VFVVPSSSLHWADVAHRKLLHDVLNERQDDVVALPNVYSA